MTALALRAGDLRSGGGGGARPPVDPADFTTRIDNPYWPMRQGSRWIYRETDTEGARQRVVVTVTRRTKLIANGVRARVVRDVVTEKGIPVEVTDDYYAQDRAGNIWYLGEATTEYENGKPVSTAGSFEAGVDGAQAGIIMPAKPRVGLTYREEFYAGHAEDRARIVSLREQAEVPFGHFTRHAHDEEHQPARAEERRVQVLRPRCRTGARRRRVRRKRPRGAGQLQAGLGRTRPSPS